MKVTILNGNPDPQNRSFDEYLQNLAGILEACGHQVALLPLREMDTRYCIGCFGCWVKTPGECVVKDASHQVNRAVINSDFTLWAAPLRMGFPSALLKRMLDKYIPLIHPYFVVEYNEAHHRPRYDRYPRLGLLLEKETGTDEKDLLLVADILGRSALNMKSRLEFSLTTESPAGEVAQRILTPTRDIVPLAKHLAPTRGMNIPAPSHLTVFNGSPRGRKGNTPIMLKQFGEGFASSNGHSYELHHLNRLQETDQFVRTFAEAECVWLGFPLYTDAMPGIVKSFIEALEPLLGRKKNPPIGFLVQSGFPEAAHSRHVERYLEKLAVRLGAPYLGTIVKGGGEGVRMMPEEANSKLFGGLQQLGKTFAETGQLDTGILREVAKPERYPAILAPVFKVFTRLPAATFYWDGQLKKNGVFEQRFAKPYLDGTGDSPRL